MIAPAHSGSIDNAMNPQSSAAKSPEIPPLGFSSKAKRTGEQPISYLMSAVLADPQLINLAAGLVDPDTLPVAAMGKLTADLFASDAAARAALQYDTTQGLLALRKAVVAHLEKLEGKPASDFAISERDVVITTGSQQALYLIGDVLLDPGDIVIAANPCYFVFASALASLGARVMAVEMQEDGIDVDAIEKLLADLRESGQLQHVKLIYSTTYFQNPTGLSLSLPKRRKLLALAQQYSSRQRILILEDAAYRELRYDGPALPSMKSMDRTNQFTILAQTFSKPFAPGIKTGYTFMPPDLRDAVLHQKGNHDFGSPSMNQHLALAALNGGQYAEQVKTLCDGYRAKRDLMLAALEKHLPAETGAHWTRPDGGLYVWLTLPPSVDTGRNSALFAACLKRGVLYVPGEYCFVPDAAGVLASNHIRLSFGQVDADKIEPGIARLASAINEIVGVSENLLASQQ